MAPLRHLNKENCCQSLVISVGIKLQGDASVVLQKKTKKNPTNLNLLIVQHVACPQ